MVGVVRKKLYILALVLLVLLLVPAQAANRKEERVPLRFDTLWICEGGPKIEWRANSAILKKFFQDRPNIKLVYLTALRLPQGMNVSGAGLTMAMVGDTAPDVISIQSEEMALAVRQGFLMPLDDYVAKWPQAKYRLKGAVRELCSGIGPDGKKHIYALPFAVCGDCIWYNRKRFREVGLSRAPRDWNELWEFGKKLYDADKDPETGLPKHWAIDLYLFGWFFQALPDMVGGNWCEQRPDGTWKTMINSKECLISLQFLEKMCWGEWTDKKGRRIRGIMEMSQMAAAQGGGPRAALNTDQRDLLEAGVTGMALGRVYTDFSERMGRDPLKFGIGPFPKYPGPRGRYCARIGGTMLGIRSTLKKNSRVAAAAWEYLTYMCGDEGEKEKTKYFVDNGVARYVNPDILRKYGYPKSVVEQIPKDWALAYKQVFEDARLSPSPPGLPSILVEMDAPCKELLKPGRHHLQASLDAVQNSVSRSYLYTPTPEEWARNKRVAFVVVIILVAVMAGGGALILRTQIRENLAAEREKVYRRKVPRSKQILAWGLMTPAILSVFMWQYVPVAWGSVMAFLNVHILGGSEWVGTDNFIRVAMRPLFWIAWRNTIVYVFLSLVMGFAAPIVLALLLSEIPKGKTLFRTLYYLPALTTGIVTALLWTRFYDPTEFGLMNRVLLGISHYVLGNINHLMAFLHLSLRIPELQAQQWLLDPKLAMAACILPTIWAGMGPGCIIYLAALKAVPEEQYDAADLDGAGVFQKVWRITLPAIFPLVLINFVGAFIGAFHGSQNILIMTGGGPNHATHVMGLEIFYQGYVLANYGQTTAIAWILGSLLVGFAVMQMRIFARMKFSTAEQGE